MTLGEGSDDHDPPTSMVPHTVSVSHRFRIMTNILIACANHSLPITRFRARDACSACTVGPPTIGTTGSPFRAPSAATTLRTSTRGGPVEPRDSVHVGDIAVAIAPDSTGKGKSVSSSTQLKDAHSTPAAAASVAGVPGDSSNATMLSAMHMKAAALETEAQKADKGQTAGMCGCFSGCFKGS